MTITDRRAMLVLILGMLNLALGTTPATAQDPPARSSAARGDERSGFHGWQIDGHIGGMPSSSASGSGTLPPPGETFTTIFGGKSRHVPSWYFGDGALLANQVAQAILNQPPPPIVPLDSILTTASASRQSGASFGFRIGHSVTRRALVEFGLDLGPGHVAVSPQALSAIEASRASFKSYFDSIISRGLNVTNVSTSSEATVAENKGRQIVATVDAAINVGTYAGFSPYVTVGGGLLLPAFDDTSVTLVGTYSFTQLAFNPLFNGAKISESDSVLVRYKFNPTVFGLIGGGVQRAMTARTGIRADVRFYLHATDMTIRLDTDPIDQPGNQQPVRIARGPNPQIQISTFPGAPSSLTPGQGVHRFDSFTGKTTQINVTVGYFLRF